MAVGSNAEGRDWGLAMIRVVAGLVFFMHGWQKFFDMGIEGVTGFFGSVGVPLPALAAPAVAILETVGGAMLAAGFLTRWVAALLAVDMLVATLLVHLPNGFFVSDGGVELTLLLMAVAVGFAVAGAGSLSADDVLTRRRTRTAPS